MLVLFPCLDCSSDALFELHLAKRQMIPKITYTTPLSVIAYIHFINREHLTSFTRPLVPQSSVRGIRHHTSIPTAHATESGHLAKSLA
jgi:hypothetical protein